MAGPDIDFRIGGDEKLFKRALVRSEKEVDKLKKKLGEAGRTSKSAFDDKGAGSIAKYATGFVSLGAALGTMNRGYDVWLKNIRASATEVQKVSRDILAFAALQEGGTKAARVKEMGDLAIRYGVTDRGLAYDTGQAMQSALGSWEKGKASAERIFAARLAGIPIAQGKELEVQAVAQGVPQGQFLRQAVIAGEASARDPKTLAGGVRGLLEFKDKTFGMAAAGVLAGPYAERLEVYLRQAAIVLQKGANKQLDKLFRKLGVKEGTKEEKLYALHAAGYRTTEQLLEAGVGELRQRQALSVLLQSITPVDPNVPSLGSIKAQIIELDKPGYLARKRVAIEKELPFMETARDIEILDAELKELEATGKFGLKAQRELREQKVRAVAFRRMGIEQAGPFDVISEEGISTRADVAQYLAMAAMGYRPPGGEFREVPEGFAGKWEKEGLFKGVPSTTADAWNALQYEMHLVREELRENTEALRTSAEGTKDAVRGGVREGMGKSTLANPDQEPP